MRTIRFKHPRTVNCWAIVCCLALLVSCVQAMSQIAGTGSIQGTIQDPSGAVIPNASVTLTDASTAVARTVKTDGSGLYSFPNIDVGTYIVDVAASGFETYQRTGIVLEIDSNI